MRMTVGKVSKDTGFSIYTLHYYEKEGILQGITRNKSGHREYSKKDINILKLIKCLRLTEMPIKELKEIIDLYYREDDTAAIRLDILKKHRENMAEKLRNLEETIEHINWKISFYEEEVKKNN